MKGETLEEVVRRRRKEKLLNEEEVCGFLFIAAIALEQTHS